MAAFRVTCGARVHSTSRTLGPGVGSSMKTQAHPLPWKYVPDSVTLKNIKHIEEIDKDSSLKDSADERKDKAAAGHAKRAGNGADAMDEDKDEDMSSFGRELLALRLQSVSLYVK